MRLTTQQIDWLNIGFMVASAAAAYALPFEVFLFAYAVLGPLHYLTEISWLHVPGAACSANGLLTKLFRVLPTVDSHFRSGNNSVRRLARVCRWFPSAQACTAASKAIANRRVILVTVLATLDCSATDF